MKPESEASHSGKTRKARIVLILITWIVALVVTFPHPAGIIWIWMFPAGLKLAISKTPPDALDGIIGWGVYVGILLWLGRAKKRWVFALAYFVLVLILAVNVSGCRHFHGGLKDLH
jgi:hypothetical protein